MLSKIKSIPRLSRSVTPVAHVLGVPRRSLVVSPETEGAALLERMDEMDTGQLLVMEEGQVIGIVTKSSVLEGARSSAG